MGDRTRFDRAYFDRWYRDPRHRVLDRSEIARRAALVLSLVVAVPLGAAAGSRRGSLLDRAVRAFAILGSARKPRETLAAWSTPRAASKPPFLNWPAAARFCCDVPRSTRRLSATIPRGIRRWTSGGRRGPA